MIDYTMILQVDLITQRYPWNSTYMSSRKVITYARQIEENEDS